MWSEAQSINRLTEKALDRAVLLSNAHGNKLRFGQTLEKQG
jgi:hypothetical protein